MSRNLGTDKCVNCDYGPVSICDLAGKPIEFRGYYKYVPVIGARWDCPQCKSAYFAAYRTRGDCVGCYPPDYEGSWEIDLSWWKSYDDEIDDDEYARKGMRCKPDYLVTEGRESQRTKYT
jgi:hypothetical protein